MNQVYRLENGFMKYLVIGEEFKPNSKFNPIQDADGNWVISEEEVQQNENPNFQWIAFLEKINFNPVIVDIWQ